MTRKFTVIYDNILKEYISNHDALVLFDNEVKAYLYLSDQGLFESPEAWSLEPAIVSVYKGEI